MATKVVTKTGQQKVLYTPNEKAAVFAFELKNKSHMDGKPLTDFQAGQRSGYLNARKDEAKLFKWKKKKGL
ncbi:hypothetical protein FACS1894211_12790 [Clostridia bacterium]|nr:hypothetical protein FACS1894211_12790 [Clostridia bacterium]